MAPQSFPRNAATGSCPPDSAAAVSKVERTAPRGFPTRSYCGPTILPLPLLALSLSLVGEIGERSNGGRSGEVRRERSYSGWGFRATGGGASRRFLPLFPPMRASPGTWTLVRLLGLMGRPSIRHGSAARLRVRAAAGPRCLRPI